ncbi:MAG: translation initiation factor IF-3 [Gammaproteobacteria bacterium]|nr:translation initiation factor IF-3 [Pseudomonadota bacterium]MDG2302577.1 translation initiation factor IF-3 [Gammaproteobacteria bacterium]MBT5065057.1 translation initiation factor IF-3 [Pseudomonadota bacterium]MBT6193225.1 translation initiation factor IF-3 [Pseudomonadota bacterium]MBT6465186.1 translation initiation factor IF-3 [Pseudomonadota bacterium]
MAADKKNRANSAIQVANVRLIGADGVNRGVVTIEEAQNEAKANGLDLVEIVPNVDPPVCRVMDFGKFLFDVNKKKHAAKKKQKQVQVKEIKFRPATDQGDYDIKLRNLRKFLAQGDKAKVTLRFRGREMAHQELGAEMLKRIETDLSELGSVEQFPKLEGRQMVMVIAPRKN